MSANLASLLVDHPFADDEPLLCTIDGCVSAGKARREAAALAERLRSFGVEPGQAVAVQLQNDPSAVIAMFGTWLAGGVFVPLNPRQTEAEVDAAIDATAPAVLFDADGVRPVACTVAVYEPDTAFVTWTSGTTGVPKPVLQTHSGYFELLDRVLGALKTDPTKRPTPNLIPVPLALNAGIYNVLFGLRAGAAIVIMDRFDTADFAELVRRFDIRSTVLPPAAMIMLADDEAVADLSPLRYVRSITAPLSPLAARRFRDKFGVTVLNGYGQAEIGEVIGWTASDARAHPDKLGAVGRPHPGVDVKVAGDDGIGELLVRPPRMAAGLDESRLDAEGFVHTGDVARIDDDGFVWIEGRIGDVINRGGNKVFPDHVEEVLRLSPAVRDVAVVGVADERLGELPVAFVVGDADASELEALCREHLVPYKVPAAFVFVESLPRSEVGKVLRRELGRVLQRWVVTYRTLEVWRDGAVGWLVFNRPDVGNAVDATMFTELEQAWAELDADDDVRVVVNTGNGDAFQTGLDVRQLATDREALREQSRRTRDFDLRMTAWHCEVWKPVVAAVNGVCAGAGLHFVADADVVIASADATFLDPHVSVGQVSAIETIGMIRKSPMEPITRMALLGRHERMTAERARQLGILSEVVEPSRLRAQAQEIAETIAQHSPAHLAMTKKALWAALEVVVTPS